MAALNRILGKFPVVLIAIVALGYLGYDYYTWLNDPTSELGSKLGQIDAVKKEIEVTKRKLVDAENFIKNLDIIRARIRQLATQLEATKATMPSEIDDANFVRMLGLEAKKLSLQIKGIRPENKVSKEYYSEVPFTVNFKGAYVQLLVFLDRISKLQQVVRISEFEMKPTGSPYTKYVELEGRVKLTSYAYLGSSADSIATKVNAGAAKGDGK